MPYMRDANEGAKSFFKSASTFGLNSSRNPGEFGVGAAAEGDGNWFVRLPSGARAEVSGGDRSHGLMMGLKMLGDGSCSGNCGSTRGKGKNGESAGEMPNSGRFSLFSECWMTGVDGFTGGVDVAPELSAGKSPPLGLTSRPSLREASGLSFEDMLLMIDSSIK